MISLVNSGVDFDSAVDLVKAAAFEIEYEEDQQVKQAAFGELLNSGVDFDLAVALVKSASEKEEGHGKTIGRGARVLGRSMVEGVAGAAGGAAVGAGIGALAAKALRKAPGVGAALGAGVGYGAGSAMGTVHGAGRSVQNQMAEKRAAVSALMGSGVDFDQAVALVQAKADELYGY